ncbi:MAG TPA: CaiB/BaiF CoA-transferase family protein [Ilumatobacteraceae bacterium]|nr:CaiB/BaiF CoA-transferase family protein [Ilumatobacteraceae bacterium]
MAGPLSGIRIVELAGIGPGPFAAMMLADMGADIIRVERAQAVRGPAPEQPYFDVMQRGRRHVALDLKHPDGVATLMDLLAAADGMIEGFRPGVIERLGLGPDVCLEPNPKLVIGRMTGWGQDGPMAHAAGHDINYISLAGALAHFARAGERPVPPINLVGDFGGGGMLLAFGMVCGLLEAQRSGQGQVIDAAMVDGAALLMSMFWSFSAIGAHNEDAPGTNLLDTGAHFYDVYETKDQRYVSLGSIEPQFYAELLQRLGLSDDPDFQAQNDKTRWPRLKERLAAIIATKTRDEWVAELEGTDVCFAPVLKMSDAAKHPHNVARGTFIDVAGQVQPAPAPRFSRTAATVDIPPAHPGQHTREVLTDWGISAERIEALLASGAAVDA